MNYDNVSEFVDNFVKLASETRDEISSQKAMYSYVAPSDSKIEQSTIEELEEILARLDGKATEYIQKTFEHPRPKKHWMDAISAVKTRVERRIAFLKEQGAKEEGSVAVEVEGDIVTIPKRVFTTAASMLYSYATQNSHQQWVPEVANLSSILQQLASVKTIQVK